MDKYSKKKPSNSSSNRTPQRGEPFWQVVQRQKESRRAKAKNQAKVVPRGTAPVEPRFANTQPNRVWERRTPERPDPKAPVRLNRFIAQAGVCSRREADAIIARGSIKVNGKVVTELGTKILPKQDRVEYANRVLTQQNFTYVLLNKPKNMITTMSDPLGRRTVLQAIERATQQRVYPVGRLDRNTTGLLLLTNDGELTKKLTHPSHRVKKLYKARLNQSVSEADMAALSQGIELEDGFAQVDQVEYVAGTDGYEVGIEIHIGRNRIVRRMFEHLGYRVEALDRIMLGHLTKKNLPRGKWRKLTDKEVGFLKMMGNSDAPKTDAHSDSD
jgi:23S rRNA pseudouridine2605 synthase